MKDQLKRFCDGGGENRGPVSTTNILNQTAVKVDESVRIKSNIKDKN